MSKLEAAVKSMEVQPTIKQRVLRDILVTYNNQVELIQDLTRSLLQAKEKLAAMSAIKLKIELILINSNPGFLVLSQDNEFKIESGFTSFEEVAQYYYYDSFKLNIGTIAPELHVGEICYRIEKNGMLHYHASFRDSSD